MRVVHYLNQFFGGFGGEERAGMPLEFRDGAVGPGKLLEQLLGQDATVTTTMICGDNYAVEHQDAVTALVLEKVRRERADLFVAGPCFLAGRYGMAAGALCSAVQEKLALPVITGMAQENPGADLYRQSMYIVDSGENSAKMRDVLARMVALARKMMHNSVIGSPEDEGYLRRGLIRDKFVAQPAGERLVEMVMAKLRSQPFESEMSATTFAPIPMPPGVKDLKRAKVMLITDGGLVPKGNPDEIQGSAATRWGSYNIKNCADLRGDDYEISHGGYDAQYVRQDPDRLVPLDVMRDLENEGAIGQLHDEFLSTSGLANPLSNTRRMGREMADKAKRLGIDAIILTSTWGTSTRSGAAITTELEKAGIPTVQITAALPVAKMVGANRTVLGNGIVHVVGDASLSGEDEKKLRRQLVEKALDALRGEQPIDATTDSNQNQRGSMTRSSML